MRELLEKTSRVLFEKTFYHAARKKNAKAIQQKGLFQKGKSTYVGTFGKTLAAKDSIYAFTDITDATRWAGKMEFDLQEDIVLVTFEDNSGGFKKDMNIQMQMSFSSSVVKQGSVPPENITKIQPVTTDMIRKVVYR